jgi:hypothetical protein
MIVCDDVREASHGFIMPRSIPRMFAKLARTRAQTQFFFADF